MLLNRKERIIYASHYQFYIEDPDFPVDPASPEFWTNTSIEDRLAIGAGVLGIGTGSYGSVRLVSEAHDSPPELEMELWDHITEAGLDISQARLQVAGCLDEFNAEVFKLASGHYRVRCCHANLDESVDVGEGGDWYLVQFWPAIPVEPRVLKQWKLS